MPLSGGAEYLELIGGLVVRDQIVAGMGVALPTSYIHQSSARTRTLLSLLGLSDEEKREQEAWGEFAVAQFTQDPK